ncbi:hypothetical protein NJ76_13525 [Rhodococcus sp. IITR03]|uniref:Phage terminase small subunit P27 family n=1 Tax=Rhodococcus pyridinivorans TaxID=103816 RepID=A0A7M2XPN3_9NOCA|nr:phage terminase small subunit P27 family [Rhodococcus pyridinivorans]KLL97549.1 hypothetical protein NJ76_13525 [Rhodococcus sp. IITR03]QOV99715.1 phage terminase small subunit P27 family [Rhodococcus pyridinivorans]
MGKGPAPRPPALKLLNGRREGYDSGGRKVNAGPGFKREPLGPPPPDLPDVAAAEWASVAPELDRLELSKAIDRTAFRTYCMAVQRLHDAQEAVDRDGLTVPGSTGSLVKHPAVAILEAAERSVRAWAQEFGLTPSAEGRISAQAADSEDDGNPFADGATS